jgi:hypothetical protein
MTNNYKEVIMSDMLISSNDSNKEAQATSQKERVFKKLGYVSFPLPIEIVKDARCLSGLWGDIPMFRITDAEQLLWPERPRIFEKFLQSERFFLNAVGEMSILFTPFGVNKSKKSSDFLNVKDYVDAGFLNLYSRSKKGGTFLSKHLFCLVVKKAFPHYEVFVDLHQEDIVRSVQARLGCSESHKMLARAVCSKASTKGRTPAMALVILNNWITQLATGMTTKQFKEARGVPEEGMVRDYCTGEERLLVDELERFASFVIDERDHLDDMSEDVYPRLMKKRGRLLVG